MDFLRKNRIYLIIFLYLIVKLFAISVYKTIWWDPAVYIGMGKHIYSLGNSGLWEPSRPLVWPLILGFFWKSDLNYIMLGRIMDILSGSLCILLTYLIGKKIFNEKIGLLSSFLLAISPTFFFFSGIMLTEPISTFFSLLAIYLLIKNRHFASGLLFGISFMIRFLQLFAFIGVILALIYNKKHVKPYPKIFFGFIIAVLPYLFINQILYHNAFFPFLQQVFLTNNSGWLNHQPISYYFIGLFKDNFLYLLSIVGIVFMLRKPGSRLVAFPFIILFLFFSLIRQKEMRLLIILLPYMCLLVSYALIYFTDLKKNLKRTATAFIFILFVSSLVQISAALISESSKTNKYVALQAGLEEAKGNIWISSPIIAASSNKVAKKLVYYPFFGHNFSELINESENADFIFIDTCDLGCRPSDAKCESNKKEMVAFFRQKFAEIYSRQGECLQLAFKR